VAAILLSQLGQHWTEALFHALQIIVLNYDHEADQGSEYFWSMKALQLVIPAFASVGLLKNLFHEQISPLFVQIQSRFQPPEVLVIGGGSVGRSIAETLATQGNRVLIVDLHGSAVAYNATAEAAHTQARHQERTKASSYRAPAWLRGDGRDHEILAGANAARARKVYICTGDDETNLQVTRQLFAFFEVQPRGRGPTSVRVHLLSDDARRAVRDWLGWYSLVGHKAVDVESFDIYEIAARELLIRYSPDRFMPTDHVGAMSQVVVVSGAGRMAQELIRRAARIGHFSANGRLHIFWVDPDVDTASRHLQTMTPHIDWQPLSNEIPADWTTQSIEHLVKVVLVPNYLTEALTKKLIENAAAGRVPAVMWACHEDSARNAAEVRDFCACYNRYPATGGTSSRAVAVQFSQTLGLSDATENTKLFAGFSCVPAEATVMEYAVDVLCDGRRDELAKYINTVIYHGRSYSEYAEKDWAALPEFIRDSNREAADHTYIKLRYSGVAESKVDRLLAAPGQRLSTIADPPAVPVDLAGKVWNALKASLSVVEHRRYCAFMFSAGFAQLEKRPEDMSSLTGVQSLSAANVFGVDKAEKHWERMVRLNASLQPFDVLTEKEKKKDDEIVRHMFSLTRENLEVRTARKRIGQVQVSFARRPGEMQTLEGTVQYGANSAIITGVAGEQWPVERPAFENKYEPSEGLQMGSDGIYVSRARSVKAVQLPAPCTFTLEGNRGDLSGRRGDWVVEDDTGELGVVARDIFEKTYELCSAPHARHTLPAHA